MPNQINQPDFRKYQKKNWSNYSISKYYVHPVASNITCKANEINYSGGGMHFINTKTRFS